MTAQAEADARAHLYSRAGDYMVEIGARGFGVQLSPDTVLAMTGGFELVARVDEVLDAGPSQQRDSILAYMSAQRYGPPRDLVGLAVGLGDEIGTLADTLTSQVAPEQAQEYINYGVEIIEINDAAKVLEDPKAYAELGMEVGGLTSKMFFAMVPPHERSQENYARYTRCIEQLARAGIVTDWAADLAEDKAEGRTVIDPTLSNKLKIMRQGVHPLLDGGRMIGGNWVNLSGIGYNIAKRMVQSAFSTVEG